MMMMIYGERRREGRGRCWLGLNMDGGCLCFLMGLGVMVIVGVGCYGDEEDDDVMMKVVARR